MDMVICGSCFTLVQVEKKDVDCPRCQDRLDPSPESRLEKFAAKGVDTARHGVPLHDAQEAAREVLKLLGEASGMLLVQNVRLRMHHLGQGCAEKDCNLPPAEGFH